MKNTLTTEKGVIEYTDFGHGKPILFLHGGHSNCNERLFHKGYDRSQFRLITPSRPGYGDTPLADYAQPTQASKLFRSLLTHLDIKQVVVIGISAGGPSAIEFAYQNPEMVTHLVLISAVTQKWLDPDGSLYKRASRLFSPEREKTSWMLFRLFFRMAPRQMAKILFKELSTAPVHKFTQEEIAEVKQMTFLQSSGSGFINDLHHTTMASHIEKIGCPTLILHSKNDKSVSIKMAHYAQKMISKSQLHLFDNQWGHLLWLGEESEKPIEIVNTFLSQPNSTSI